MKKSNVRILIRNFLIELVVYAFLVILYSALVLKLLGTPLNRLFHNNLLLYALVGLLLIIAQGVALDAITSFLLDRLKLGRLE